MAPALVEHTTVTRASTPTSHHGRAVATATTRSVAYPAATPARHVLVSM